METAVPTDASPVLRAFQFVVNELIAEIDMKDIYP